MEQLISLFIDNEMNMDDKISFVMHMQSNPSHADEALSLLKQEKLLRTEITTRVPENTFRPVSIWDKMQAILVQPKALIPAVLTAAVAVLILFLWSPTQPHSQPNRFVLYRPDISRVEITGSFTDWQRVPMRAVGNSGYWELVLAVPEGEHRFSYISNGKDSFPDPTILTREQDDFGGQNSVIIVGDQV
jgi:AMP-activated protein kinase-like protein